MPPWVWVACLETVATAYGQVRAGLAAANGETCFAVAVAAGEGAAAVVLGTPMVLGGLVALAVLACFVAVCELVAVSGASLAEQVCQEVTLCC